MSCTLLYHAYYYSKVARLPRHIFKGKINIIRRTWVENMLKPGQAITAVQSLRNIHMAASFLASSSIVFIGSIIYLIFNIEQTSGIVTGRGTIALPDYLLFLKLLCTNDHVSSIPFEFYPLHTSPQLLSHSYWRFTGDYRGHDEDERG